MSSTAIPNLYLKWRAFREIVGHPHSDAQIAEAVFGANDGSVKFSKLLYGDYGCSGEIAAELATIVNKRIEAVHRVRGQSARAPEPLRIADIGLPVYEFVHRLLTAIGTVDGETLDRAHRSLLEEMTAAPCDRAVRLRIERYSTDRAFEGSVPSGGSGPIVFEPRRHLGKIAVEGLQGTPAAAYALFVRDPQPAGHRLWDLRWGETVLWLPSPFTPSMRDGALELMAEPQPVKPIAGRYVVIAVVAMDRAVLATLDPRGKDAPKGALDELETARFLTNLRRIAKRKPETVAVASSEYMVAAA
jgi:hypothetical protein